MDVQPSELSSGQSLIQLTQVILDPQAPRPPPGPSLNLNSNRGVLRRFACDRCRAHKLRCNRDPTASVSTPCIRCSKAKAKCTISPSFRPGKSSVRQEQGNRVLNSNFQSTESENSQPTLQTQDLALNGTTHSLGPNGTSVY